MTTTKLDGYPEEIVKLIEMYGGSRSRAEKAAHIGGGYFTKLRMKQRPYTDIIKKKVFDALNGTPSGARGVRMSSAEIPDTCPPLLRELVIFKGNKKEAMKTLGASDSMFYKIQNGKRPMPPEWIIRIKAELGRSVIGVAPTGQEAQGLPVAPPFKPWDGKSKGNLKVAGRSGAKDRIQKGVPQPIIDLVEKHGGITGAANAMGASYGSFYPLFKDHKKFNLKWQERVHLAQHGIMAGGSGSAVSEDFDKYSLGIAIVVLNGSQAFDRVQDIVEILDGRMVFRKHMKSGWLLIYKMSTVGLQKFKKLAIRDCNEIVCP